MRSFWIAGCILLCLSLSACGGGGGSTTTQPPATTEPGSFTLSATTATFSAVQGGTIPSSTSIAMTITGSNVALVGAAYIGGQTQPSWLGINITGTGTSYNVVLNINGTNLAPGQYTSTFSVGTADAGSNILKSQAITVTYTVTARIAIASSAYSSTFIYGDTRTQDTVSLPVTATNRTWSAVSSAAWLQVPGATQIGSSTLSPIVDVSTLAPGTYSGTVTVTNASNAQDTASLSFSVVVQSPTLTVQQTSILLGGTDGLSSSPQTLSFSLSSGNATHPFTLSASTDSGGNWLKTNASSGTVGSSGTSVQISAQRGSLVGSTYTGQLTLTATVRNLVFQQLVPVTYNVEAHRIVLGATGVGFSWSPAPARSVLTRKVKVFSSIGRTDTPWSAASDQPWLTVTSSGTTGGTLTLTADPTGLAPDLTYFATVSVISSDPLVENQTSIRVGFHINSTAPTDGSVSTNAQRLVTSPVEPLVFINNGGNQITAYDVYTRAVVRTFNTVLADAGSMVMSGDGRYLFVYDRTNIRVTQLDATSGTLVRHYASTITGGTPAGDGIAYIRPNGFPVIVTPAGRMYDTDTGTEYQSGQLSGAQYAVSLAPSEDSTYVVTDFGTVYHMSRSALSGGTLTANIEFSTGTAGGREGQACISEDARYVYTASGAPYNFPGTDMLTHQIARTLPGTNYPNSMICLWNGVLVGGVDGYYAAADVFIYDGPTGQQLATVSSSSSTTAYRSLLDRGMAASADATRLITLSGGSPGQSSTPELRLQALPGAL